MEPSADDGAELLELVHGLLHALRRGTADDAVTPGQLRFLRTLQRAGTPRRPGELAAALGMAPRSMTTKVDQAEADGLVARLPDPSDRRATLVALTPAGEALLAERSSVRLGGATERLSRLDPTERAELLRLLRVVADPDATPDAR